MDTPIDETPGQQGLRSNAEARLGAGTAPPSVGWTLSVDALTLLHRLASNTATADDALKLLHELQVHQVELDLQSGQLEANERELAGDLARYKRFFNLAPVGYLILDSDGVIVEVNQAGSILLGVGADQLNGHRCDEVVAPESRLLLRGLLKRLGSTGTRQVCRVNSQAENNHGALEFAATLSEMDGSILVTVSPCN